MNRLKIERVTIPILIWLVVILWAESAIADNQYVKVGLGQNPPLTIRNEGSVPTGLAIDIIQDVAKIEDWQVEFVEDGWRNLLGKLETGEIDILTGIAYSKNREERFDFTSEAIVGNWGIVYRQPSIKVNSILDLSGLRIAMGPKGAHAIALVKLLKDFGVTYSVVETRNYDDVFDRVEKGEADVGVVSRLFGVSQAENRQVVATGISFNPVGILFATPKGKGTDLLVALNAYLVKGKKDSSSSYQAHLERWIQSSIREEIPLWVIWGSTGTAFGLLIALLSVGVLRRRVEVKTRELQKSEAQFRRMIEKSPLPMVITDQNQDISFINDKFTELFGYTLEDVSTADEWWSSAYPDLEYREKVQNSWVIAIEKASATGTDIDMQEWALTIKDGTQRECEFYMVPLQDKSLIIMNDISERKNTEVERKKLELRLQQGQKMEAIGTLAGGIAHDFNNLLAVILGYTDLAKEDAPPGTHFRKDLEEVTGAAIRAKELVMQILAFSRQTEVEQFHIKIQPLIKESLLMLRSSIPTTISIVENIDPKCGTIHADPSQVHQVLMNLCTNAFHAMEDTGGTLSVALKDTYIKPDDKNMLLTLTPGEYIKFTVSDTGVGIGPDVIEKIFDPYFTTKEVGRGTGMGLAIIHGIMNECGGGIIVESQLGEGATFHVYFPAVKEDVFPADKKPKDIPRGKERVLFIDDEAILADMGKDMLERLGYHVTVRYSSFEALETFQNTPDKFDLVITDQTMPGMTGTDLARRILQIRPMIPIILCTGYSSIIDEDSTKGLGIKEFALKPLTKEEIAKLIRKVLDVA